MKNSGIFAMVKNGNGIEIMKTIIHQDSKILSERIQQLAPWFSAFDFGNGLKSVPLVNPECNENYFKTRADRVFDALAKHVKPEETSILDVGCSDGYFTIEAAKRGYKEVLGVDFRQDSIERANFAKEMFGLENVEFCKGNVYELEKSCSQKYDVVICQGLMYHLSHPILALENIYRMTENLAFVAGWTVIRKDACYYVRTEDVGDIRNGDKAVIMVPTCAGLIKSMEAVGFKNVYDTNPWTTEPDWTSDQGDWRELIGFR